MVSSMDDRLDRWYNENRTSEGREDIKFIRIVLVTISTFAASGLTVDFFNGLLILSAGFCYDYYDWLAKGKRASRIFGYIAFGFSFLLFMFSLMGLMNYVELDCNTGIISANTLLLPDIKIDLSKNMFFLWAFPLFSGIEVFLGRNDFVDKGR